MHIIPVASGKGGVGKSLVAANLAIALAQGGKRVVLADLDLGGSNLHLILGMRAGVGSIGAYLTDPTLKFENAIQTTDVPNLLFLPGDAEIPGLANLSAAQKRTLTRRLSTLQCDYLITDLGAGTHQNALDFFLMSGSGIVVSTPTPTATVNAYLFLKNAVFRIMQSSVARNGKGAAFIKDLFKHGGSLQRLYFPDLIKELAKHEPGAVEKFRAGMAHFRPRLILNMIEDPKDAEKANRLRRSCQQYLDIDLLHLGVMYRDDLQDTALNARIPIIRYKPQAVLSQAIYRVAEKVVQLTDTDDSPVDMEALNDSFDAAELEAESDFESKMNYIEELLHTGALSNGDLVETIKSQQHEIVQLRRQNELYKSKLLKAAQQGFKL